jgi:hypothetical protein
MPSPFDNIEFAKYNKQYISQPIDEVAKTVTMLNKRYDEGSAMNDALQSTLSSIQVDPQNQEYIANRAAIIDDNLRELVTSGRFEHGSRLLKSQFNDLTNDKAVRSSIEHYNAREATKANLREKYEKGFYNDELYQDEMDKFNDYQGIGTPDDFGNYNKYNHEEGAKYFDIDTYSDQLMRNYQGGNTTTNQTSNLKYGGIPGITSEQAKQYGLATGETTKSTKYTDGTEAQGLVQEGILSNPDALAYIDRLVDIRNRKGIPTTRDEIIKQYTDRAFAKYSQFDQSTASQERAIDMQAASKAIYGDGNGQEEFMEATPLPALKQETNVNDQVGNWWTRTGTNLLGSVGTIMGDLFSPKNLLSLHGVPVDPKKYPNSKPTGEKLRENWQSAVQYRKEQVNKLPVNEQNKIAELIYTYGSESDRKTLNDVNGDITKLPGTILSRAIDNVKKNNTGEDLLYTNYQHTPVGVVNKMIATRFPEGTKLGDIGKNNPVTANTSIIMYGKDGKESAHFNTFDEFLKAAQDGTIPKELLDTPIQNIQEYAISQRLGNVSGDTNMDLALSFQVGDRTLAMGIANTDNPSQYVHFKTAYTREYRHIAQRARPNQTVQKQIAENQPIGTIPNYFKTVNNQITDEKYEVFSQKILGNGTNRWAIRNPTTGNISGEYNTFEEALYDISTQDQEYNKAYGDKNTHYNTLNDAIRYDELKFK